jgi:ADP-L-glycero-D-manno-heptose 6-epimerase
MWVITGATGFIGSALVWELNQHGLTDLIVSDHVNPEERPGVLKNRKYREFIRADRLSEYLRGPAGAGLSGILHMGACSSTTETDEAYLQKNNVEYSQHMFEICRDRGVPLIYASSGATYGDGALGFDDERNPSDYKPLNLYGWSKLKFDIWADKQASAPPHWFGLRFFNVYGPNEYHKGEMSSVVYKAYKQIRETGRLRLFKSHNPEYKDGEQLRDFVYVKDITRWMRELMARPNVRSGIYNMGFGKARTWLDLARGTFAGMKKPLSVDWIDIPPNIRNQYQYFTEAKMTKLMAQGLSKPEWPLEKGVRDYVENYLLAKDPYL